MNSSLSMKSSYLVSHGTNTYDRCSYTISNLLNSLAGVSSASQAWTPSETSKARMFWVWVCARKNGANVYRIALSKVTSFILPFRSTVLVSPRPRSLGSFWLSRLPAIHEVVLQPDQAPQARCEAVCCQDGGYYKNGEEGSACLVGDDVVAH